MKDCLKKSASKLRKAAGTYRRGSAVSRKADACGPVHAPRERALLLIGGPAPPAPRTPAVRRRGPTRPVVGPLPAVVRCARPPHPRGPPPETHETTGDVGPLPAVVR